MLEFYVILNVRIHDSSQIQGANIVLVYYSTQIDEMPMNGKSPGSTLLHTSELLLIGFQLRIFLHRRDSSGRTDV